MGLLTTLEKCASIEETVGEIYRRLAEAVACDGLLRKIWRQMAQDEEAHAAQLRMARRMAKVADLTESRVAAGEVELLARRALDVLAEITTERPSVDGALLLSVGLEQEFLRLHAPNSLSLQDPGLRALFLSLSRADGEHLQALQEYRSDRSALLAEDRGRAG
jgi:rubrerythrin